jgi:hypothetical protein
MIVVGIQRQAVKDFDFNFFKNQDQSMVFIDLILISKMLIPSLLKRKRRKMKKNIFLMMI